MLLRDLLSSLKKPSLLLLWGSASKSYTPFLFKNCDFQAYSFGGAIFVYIQIAIQSSYSSKQIPLDVSDEVRVLIVKSIVLVPKMFYHALS